MVLPVPYRTICDNCNHPVKFHSAEKCLVDGCSCPYCKKKELKEELCIDAETFKPICNYCLVELKENTGICVPCKKEQEQKKKNAT